MKKLWLLMVLFLFGCSKIETTLYIDSIGIDVTDEYEVYMYSLSSLDSLQNIYQGENNKALVAYEKGSSITECISKIEESISEDLNYELLKSVILTPNYLNNGNVELLLQYFGMKHKKSIDFSFFIAEDIKEIFNSHNPDKAIMFNPIFLSPVGHKTIFNNVSFVKFTADYYEKYKVIIIPYLDLTEEIWTDGEEKYRGVVAKGIGVYDEKLEPLFLTDYPELYYLHPFVKRLESIKDGVVDIRSYSLDITNKKNTILFNVSLRAKCIMGEVDKSEVKDYIYSQIAKLIEINKKYDFFNLNNLIYKEKMNQNKVNMEINIRLTWHK